MRDEQDDKTLSLFPDDSPAAVADEPEIEVTPVSWAGISLTEQPPLFEAQPDWSKHMTGMPDFEQNNLMPWKTIKVHFRNLENRREFANLIEQNITDLTVFVWYPKEERKASEYKSLDSARKQPQYPVFIPSKGRHESLLTMKAFDAISTRYTVFVEPQEYDAYAKVIPPHRLHRLPHRDRGLVVTRNYIWDYAKHLEVERFWTFDDNIKGFTQLNNNTKTRAIDGSMFALIEDFANKYENVVIAGCNYSFFAKRKQRIPPYVLNTRIYSNMLIKTDAPFRNEGFYNDDTDLCLRVLKAGLCTVQFNTFLIDKSETMTVKGGMTPHYQDDGRYKMAKELADKHPDVVTITQKFGRYQHQVNYAPFKKNKLILKED